MVESFRLDLAQDLFLHICNKMQDIKLIVTDIEPGKNSLHSEATTIYFPFELEPNQSAFGSIQYYGGPRYYSNNCVRVVELRFYFKFIDKNYRLKSLLQGLNKFRVKDRKGYLAFQFNNYDNSVLEFINMLADRLKEYFVDMYDIKYAKLENKLLPSSIKELPRY